MTLSPDDLPNDAETLRAMILAARADNARLEAERLRLQHEEQVLAGEVDRLTVQTERLDHIIAVLRRSQFGRRSEKISDDQIELALEDVETTFGAEDAAAEKIEPIVQREGTKARRANRGHLPKYFSERLDRVPAKLRVIVTRRSRYGCRSCAEGVVQAPASACLIEGGLPTEALVADIVVAKYAWHQPLYRQAQMLAAEGIEINRSTLAHWVGFAAFELAPLRSAGRPSDDLDEALR